MIRDIIAIVFILIAYTEDLENVSKNIIYFTDPLLHVICIEWM